MIRDLVIKNRSYRRFYQDEKIDRKTLEELVDLARLSASASNNQPLKYILCNDPETNALICSTIGWAGALKDWDGPVEGERPAAYIAVLGDKQITERFLVDHGIAGQSILLGAVEKGLGGCMLMAIKREQLFKILNIPEHCSLLMLIALGKPKERVVVDECTSPSDTQYWRDEQQTHHVPKRKLSDIIIG
ncbi:MAG: nitroreductase family protein [Chloroflexi bacterium]|jgi:nitroreductase|nr:nitroreductase family protein [Chloroflexota bacterium]MBT7081331.1 nitroreductase family protein [Chloroflexota bacterium]MBT7290823.1 nitroreductase family protein [Chloroflexota bacterium]